MTEQGGFKKPVKVVIDGREIVAEAGEPLLQVALDNGVEIPHYCYHPKLSIDGSCRMCQVKIEKAPKLAISCNTPVTDGMVVDTKAAEVVEVRKAVMELLLLNHPLDCPICDQAGECYLQDYSFGHGRSESRTTSPRRKGLKRYPIGPRVVFDQERCILCRRCVRFTHEISKTDELRVFGAGDRSHIATSKDRPLDNPYSINVADVCPVGALLSADFHHKRRVWFLEETETVCPTCSNGCNVKIGAFRNRIERLVPRRNDEVNDTWMCDHGRLNYEFVQDETRLREAAIAGREPREALRVPGPIDYTRDSDGNEVRPSGPSVDEAIAAAAASLRAGVATWGEKAVAVVLTPTLTNEETLLLARLVREDLKTPHFALAVPLGLSDDFLIKPEKVANARGARDLGVGPGDGGKDLAGILAACASGEIKVLWVIGSDGLVAAAGLDAVEAAVANLEALVLQDTNRTALTDRATVLVPGCTWAEKDGSMTNHAGRVQRIRAALRPPAGLVPDGEIVARLSSALRGEAGAPFEPRAAFAEVAKAVPSYDGLEWGRLGSRGLAAGQGA